MLLGKYGDDPDAWLETMDDPHQILFARDAIAILAKGIRAERIGRPALALAHYRVYEKCGAVLFASDGVSWRFARWRIKTLSNANRER